VTGDGTAGSGDIGVPYGTTQKASAYNNRKKKSKKKEKEPKKYKLSDLVKFERFDPIKYILENFNLKSVDSKEFQKMMDKVEKTLKSTSNKKAKNWKDTEEKDLFAKLEVKNWKDAYEKNPSACVAYKSRLDDYFNIPVEKVEDEEESKKKAEEVNESNKSDIDIKNLGELDKISSKIYQDLKDKPEFKLHDITDYKHEIIEFLKSNKDEIGSYYKIDTDYYLNKIHKQD